MNNPQYRLIFISIALSVCMAGAGWYARGWYFSRSDNYRVRRVAVPGFHFTSPLLDVELPEGFTVGHEPIPFKHKVLSAVQELIDRGMAAEIAVFYRDLHDGPWFGINENAVFNPASMMKVPVMIAWLKRAEADPKELNRTFTYSGEEDVSKMQLIPAKQTLASGRSYTVEELLHFMISYSDNNATALLYNDLKTDELDRVLDGMDVNNQVVDHTNAISVHGYSGFFRILYNASFLSREMSEKALALLSNEDFPGGIIAGVPHGTEVAAKFGEYGEEGMKQLHEFGIIYHPAHPYILGIMTKGNDYEKQKEALAAVSRTVWKEVDAGKWIGDSR